MACVSSMYQADYQQYHDAMAIRRGPIQRMNQPKSAILRTAEEVKLINLRIYESQRTSQIANGRRPLIISTHGSPQAPSHVQWVQRLPSDQADYEDFLETALEEAVGQLVCAPDSAAEEVELGYNYDIVEDAAPEAWVRVQAQLLETKNSQWIAASISSKAEPGERPAIYAYGRWIVTQARRNRY